MKRTIIVAALFILIDLSGVCAQNFAKIDSLENLLQEANQPDSIKYLLLIGENYFTAEDYSTSLDYFFSCLKLSEAINNVTGSADAANNIGRVYYNMENFSEGLEFFNKALNYFTVNNDEEGQGGVLNNIALIYYELDSIDLAIDNYSKALEIKKKYKDTLDIGAISHNLGLVYMNENKFDLAIQNLITSRDIFVELGFANYAANATNNIGRAYYRSGEYEKALDYFQKGIEEAKKINSSFLLMDNYKYQSDCYAKMDNYREAYRYSNEYYMVKDSLLNIDKEKELAEIQAKYENEIEEQENQLLKKENEANAATIKMQYIIGIGFIIISILAGVLAVIYYRGNQIKKKANELLKNQKVEIEEKNKTLSQLNEEITNQNEEIKIQKKELEDLNGIKDKLFSIISHEFRSPLNSLKGTLALLKVGALSNEELNLISKELTDKINNTSIFLDNLLNWAKSQMHGINAKPENIDLRDLADENIQLLRSMADKKQLRILNKIDEKCNAYVDPNMMNLIFKNLISNAIKFSLRGGNIEINVEKNGKMNTVSIKDYGIGMANENLKMLFQIQTFTTRGTANERGTGLGLFITKNFIESNGGKIWAESEEGKGSSFKFTIPNKENTDN